MNLEEYYYIIDIALGLFYCGQLALGYYIIREEVWKE